MSIPDHQVDSVEISDHEPPLRRSRGLGGQLECFLKNASDAMLAVDGEGAIIFVNSGVTSLFGYSEPELLGCRVDRLIPAGLGDEDSRRVSALLLLSDSSAKCAGIEVEGRHKDGAIFALEVGLALLGAAHDDIAIWTIRDVTERKREAERIERSEARLKEAQRIAQIGNWEWDIVNDGHWWSDELYRMLEIDQAAEGRRSYDTFRGRIHPEDRERFHLSAERILKTGESEVTDIRIVLPDGREKVVQSQGDIAFDSAGRPVRLSGTLQDITERKAAEAALRLSEYRYREAQRIAKLGNWEWDLATGESWWSDELYSILEEDPNAYEASLDNFLRKVHAQDRRLIEQNTRAAPSGPSDYTPAEIRLELDGGRRKVIELKVDVRTDVDGRPSVVAGTVRDVTERWELESRLRESEARYSSTVELAALGMAHVDLDGRFIWVNQYLCEMLGYARDELLGRTIKQVSHPDDIGVTDQARADLHARRVDSLKIEKRYVRKDGAVIWVRITSASRSDGAGNVLYDISIVEDVSDRKAAEARVQYLATHDEMTGLPNRVLLNELVSEAIESAERDGRKCAVLFIDLDRFKIVNDSLGHHAGDVLLKEMSLRLRECVRESDVIARLGGDEFVVLLKDVVDQDSAAEVARKILHCALKPIEIMSQECRVTASVGIAICPDDAWDAPSLMKHADVAMYSAKEEGKNNFQFYSAQGAPIAVEHLVLESHLNHALEQNEFSAHYQARVNLADGTITGAEALLRWWNPKLGSVSPAQFIPLAEDTGLIVPIGNWILRTACEQNVAWQRKGLRPLVIAVNLSPRQFKDPDLLGVIADVLERTRMAPELLELEITESMIMHDVDRAVERARAIKTLGVRLAIDDFGTGYSSLSQLKRLPIDTLKIDRSFVRDVAAGPEDRAIAETIISLGKTLGVTVVAEGVETKTQLEFLREHACDEMQGFYFSKPCHPDAFAQLLAVENGERECLQP
jgi:diguanylate cyclase (GGDEF)-like protein/PAS domain S-box-containing protein